MASTLQDIFERVIGLEGAERAAALAAACGGDRSLQSQVEALVGAHDRAAKFLASPTAEAAALKTAGEGEDVTLGGTLGTGPANSDPMREGAGSRIGPYKLLELIGEGGFGSVFMAEQHRPVQRRVALKIIKLGMDTRQVVARFEQERQALAMMDHPNIAKVFDAGATETGRPYFVMELVKGEPLADYADRHNLSIEDRLELFAQVCQAVQHAHTKGIIHRDLKPGNVLIALQDGRPSAKVIDFGIAKATQSRMTEKTLFTEHRQIIGTPEYMSPEQAEGSLDIDTRTDVYALGVMLYELLTGSTPFGGGELRSAAYAEMQRIIREVDPPKPSTRLIQNSDTLANVAARRKTEPKRLGSLVRGELDWIVMKALEKDRARRYETANGLAADIRRYLAGEAVVAAPPSAAYRFKKFVKRNRVMVSAGSAVGAALLFGLAGTAWQAKIAREQRDAAFVAQLAEAEQRKQAESSRAEALEQKARAEANEAEARKQEAEARRQEGEAKKQAAIAEAVATFQTEMLAAVDPANLPKDPVTGEPLKDAVTVVQAIEAAVKKLDADGGGAGGREGGQGALKDQPLVEAEVRDTIGKTLQGLGRYADAEPNLRRSLALRRAALPAGHRGITTGLNNLAITLQSQNKLAEAEPLMREALAISRVAVPANLPGITTALNNLAYLLYFQNKLAEAEPLLGEALAIRRAALPAGDPNIAIGIDNLAEFLRAQNKLAEAEPLFREALAIRRAALPSGHPDIAISLDNLAKLLSAETKLDEAVPLMREALDIRRAAYSDGHPDIGKGLNNLANLLLAQNKPAEAEPLQREALAIHRAALPAGHPDIAPVLITLATILRHQNKLAEAEPLFREALPIWRAAFPAGHPQIASNLSGLAAVLRDQNKPAEAEPLYREALAINRAAFPAGHPGITGVLNNLARVQQALGQTAEARVSWDEAIGMLRKNSPDGSATLARALWRSGAARLENKDNAAALADLEEAVAMGEKFLKPDDKQLKEIRETLTKCKAVLAEQGEPDAK